MLFVLLGESRGCLHRFELIELQRPIPVLFTGCDGADELVHDDYRNGQNYHYYNSSNFRIGLVVALFLSLVRQIVASTARHVSARGWAEVRNQVYVLGQS